MIQYTFRGSLAGRVVGVDVSAEVEIEIQTDGGITIGGPARARARLLSDPGPFDVSPDWSRWHKADIGGKPAIFDVLTKDGKLKGLLTVDWSETDSITVSANGQASIFQVEILPSTLPCVAKTDIIPVNPVIVVPEPVIGDEIFRKVYKASDGDVGYEVHIPYGWPRKTGKNGKTVNAICRVGPVGGKQHKFDFLGVGQNRKTLNNLYGGPGSEYFQPFKEGDPVEFSFTDLNGHNETAAIEMKWAWRDTY